MTDHEYSAPHELALTLFEQERNLVEVRLRLENIGTQLEADGPGGFMDFHAEEYLEVAAKQLEESARQLRSLKDYTRTGVDRRNAEARRA